MNKHLILTADMLKRVDRFLHDYPIDPPLPRLAAAHANVVTVITAIDTAAEAQLSGANRSEGGVDLRESTARELRAYLKDVCRIGRVLDDEHPGIRRTFRLPESGSYPALLTAARSIIAAATPLITSFIEAGLPANFLAELQSLITAFEAATGQKHSGRTNRTLYTAALKEKAKAGIAAAKKLDAYVRNHFRSHAEMLAAWTSARHIQRPPKRKQVEDSGAPAVQPTQTKDDQFEKLHAEPTPKANERLADASDPLVAADSGLRRHEDRLGHADPSNDGQTFSEASSHEPSCSRIQSSFLDTPLALSRA